MFRSASLALACVALGPAAWAQPLQPLEFSRPSLLYLWPHSPAPVNIRNPNGAPVTLDKIRLLTEIDWGTLALSLSDAPVDLGSARPVPGTAWLEVEIPLGNAPLSIPPAGIVALEGVEWDPWADALRPDTVQLRFIFEYGGRQDTLALLMDIRNAVGLKPRGSGAARAHAAAGWRDLLGRTWTPASRPPAGKAGFRAAGPSD